jgi:conjugative relaxase-like TrwC/TraI family protein
VEDYYSGQGEATGRWVGHAASALGLDGDVEGEDLRAVLAGLMPGTGLTPNGGRLRVWKGRIPGFDVTFSVPKSVSVVYALGDPQVQAAVVEAGEAAVAAALGWLEREACFVRRGSNNCQAHVADPARWGTRRLPGAGFVAARFRHRTSRAGDPQLHWHVLVANLTRGPDGRWSALDGTAIYRSKRAAGALFQAVLREELTLRLELEWLPISDDVAEVAGVPRRVCRWFSKRRVDIEAELERLGQSGPVAAQAATLATRPSSTPVDQITLAARWREQAEGLGWGPGQLDALLARDPDRTAATAELENRGGFVAAAVERLTVADGVFTRHDVTQTVAGLLPAGAHATMIDRLAATVIASDEVLSLPVPLGSETGWEIRFTTRRLVHVEEGLTAAITNGRAARRGALPTHLVDAALAARPSLIGEQPEAVRRLTRQGNTVEVLIGRAGTGKTTTLAAVAAAYQQAGWAVLGVAPSARAARELEEQAGIPAFTIPRYHQHLTHHPLASETVVVVDEAGMVSTLDLGAIIDTVVAAEAKVVLVGDSHQLPEIGPGGALAAAIDLLDDQTCELTVNRRQQHQWEIEALEQLRHGDPAAAWHAYRSHHRVHLNDNPDDVRRRAVADWWHAYRTGAHSLLLAGTKNEADHLNQLARGEVGRVGHLTGDTLTVAGRCFQIGDRVLCIRNATDLTTPDGQPATVDNGTLATVIAIRPNIGALDIAVIGSHRRVRLDRRYLEDGHLVHGYAMTIHKAQGATCDRAYVVGPAGLYREAAYVALSRARDGAHLYATTHQAAELDNSPHSTGIPDPRTDRPEGHLLDRLHHSRAKTFASHHAPDALTIDKLAQLPLDVLDGRLLHTRTAERRAVTTGFTDPHRTRADLDYAIHVRSLLAVDGRVRALDWDNVGTIRRLHDHNGTAVVRFVAADGATATRTLPWSRLHPIDRHAPTALTHAAQQWIEQQHRELHEREIAWADTLATQSVQPDDTRRLTAAVELRTQRLGNQLRAEPPAWLTWWLGPRPTDPAGATTHDDTITQLAAWRDRHHLRPSSPGYGPPPGDPNQNDDWRHAMDTTLTTRTWLTQRSVTLEPVALPTWTEAEINDRLHELDQILATAPPDQARLIDDLTAGRLTVDDVQQVLDTAHHVQAQRRDWILTHWPHVVEHHELQRVAQSARELPSDVTALIDRLATITPALVHPEQRTLADLHDQLDHLDPGQRLRQLTVQLTQLGDRNAAIHQRLDADSDPSHRDLLTAEADVVSGQRQALRLALAEERARLAANSHHSTGPTNQLREAIADRTATITNDALTRRPEWLTGWLTKLHLNGSLSQIPDHTLHTAITNIAHYRDRWHITTADALGTPPEPDDEQFRDWRQLAGRPLLGSHRAPLQPVELGRA